MVNGRQPFNGGLVLLATAQSAGGWATTNLNKSARRTSYHNEIRIKAATRWNDSCTMVLIGRGPTSQLFSGWLFPVGYPLEGFTCDGESIFCRCALPVKRFVTGLFGGHADLPRGDVCSRILSPTFDSPLAEWEGSQKWRLDLITSWSTFENGHIEGKLATSNQKPFFERMCVLQ